MLKLIFSLSLIMSVNNLYQAATYKKIKGYNISTSVRNLKIGFYFLPTKLECLLACSKIINCTSVVFDYDHKCILYRDISSYFLIKSNNNDLELYYNPSLRFLSIAYYNRKMLDYNGLIHYWPFNGINNDLIGNANLTSIGDKDFVLDPYGNTVVYLRQSYYQLPADVYFNGSFSITAWFRIDTFKRFSRLIDCGNERESDNIVLTLTSHDSLSISFSIYSGSSGKLLQSSSYLPGGWYFLAATFDGTFGAIYLNGSKVAQGDLDMPRNIIREKCFIGASNWPFDLNTEAYISDFKIYNRCLSQNDITNEFN